MHADIRIGLVGHGYWGRKLARNLRALDGCRLLLIGDTDPSALADACRRHPGVAVTGDPWQAIADPRIDAVVIATPAATHFALALQALRSGKHVLAAKPLATASGQVRRLVDAATRRGLVLMVDHTFVHSGAVRKIRSVIESGALGEIRSAEFVRLNAGPPGADIGVVWDLAVHDLSILDYALGRLPSTVSATARGYAAGRPEHDARVALSFDGSLAVGIHVGCLAAQKVRRALICGSDAMLEFDDLEPHGKIRFRENGVAAAGCTEGEPNPCRALPEDRTAALEYDRTEPLRTVVADFLGCISHGGRPLSDGESALRIARVIEAAYRSMSAHGAPVALVPANARASGRETAIAP